MYQYKSAEFGDFLKYTFYNDETNNSFSIVPEHGACLLDVKIGDQSIIDGYQTIEELLKNEGSKSAILFPFPNRLKGGKYNFEGKSYQFPINEKITNNALHGFAKHQVFSLEKINCSKNQAEIHCRHQNKGNNPAYPFAFRLDVKMRISDPDSFEIELLFKNESSQKILVGLGWHPYFNCFGNLDQVSLQMPHCQFVEIDEFAIPTKERFDYTYFKNQHKFGNAVLDNAFELQDSKGKATVTLISELGKLIYWQETGYGKYNFLQIFTPPQRKSIAIEPMTCNIDAFNNGEGLIVLKPKEKCSGKCGFSFETAKS
jgi:aldose 1-epimerase